MTTTTNTNSLNIRAIMAIAPVIPVIIIEHLAHAVPLAQALCRGGLQVLEVTLRTPVALDAIKAMRAKVPEAIVGVGTLTEPKHFAAAQQAGAQFGVSPGLTIELAHSARQANLPLLPGVMTPTDVIAARLQGYTALKLFPALQAGGIGMLKALHSPFSDVVFCPTGGINRATAAEFLALPNVPCVGGSWLTPKTLLDLEDWSAIEQLARDAAQLGKKTI